MHRSYKNDSYSTFSFSWFASKHHMVTSHHKSGQGVEVPGHSLDLQTDGLGEAERPPSE